jgi:hypothetical protein
MINAPSKDRCPIIPEFSSFLVPVLVAVTLLVVMIYRKKGSTSVLSKVLL